MVSEPANLEDLLDRASQAAQGSDRTSLGTLLSLTGDRSFGALLLVAGVILISPLSGIPGMASLMALWVFLVAVQLLCRRQHFWLPRWLLSRSVKRRALDKALTVLRRPARRMDSWLKPRLKLITNTTSTYIIALVCLLLALIMPAMELVPFSATAAGLPLTLFGLSLIARDGLLTLIALAFTALPVALVLTNFIL